MKILFNLKFYLVIVAILLIWLTLQLSTTIGSLQRYKTLYENEKHKTDSLEVDNQLIKDQLSRFEIGYEILLGRNTDCAIEYGNIIANETK
jgi:hypothetical protein